MTLRVRFWLKPRGLAVTVTDVASNRASPPPSPFQSRTASLYAATFPLRASNVLKSSVPSASSAGPVKQSSRQRRQHRRSATS